MFFVLFRFRHYPHVVLRIYLERIDAMTDKLVYRPAEAQAALGIKNTLFWQLVKEGKLETRKIGSATVVPADSLKAFLAGLPKPRAA